MTIYLFNLAGYFFFFKYFIDQSEKQLISRIDNEQYNNNGLIEVKIPLHLPYTTNWSEYERVDGEMEYKGVFYSYVKRKVSNDTLYLMCLPNEKKTKLYNAASEYASKVNDIPSGEKDGNSVVKKVSIFNECIQPVSRYNFSVAAIILRQHAPHFNTPLSNSFIADLFQPPEVKA